MTNDIVTIFTAGIHHKYWYFDNVVQTSNVCCLRTNCSIPFKLTAFIADIHRYLHVNFLSKWLSFTVNKYCNKLSGLRCSCVLWICRNTMHLKFLKNIKFKGENMRPLGITHVVLFIF